MIAAAVRGYSPTMCRFTCTALLLGLAACVGPKGNAGTMLTPAEANAKTTPATASTLGPGDVVEVRVFQEADLSGPFRISPEGTIDYPLCGRVTVGGKTSSAVADVLTECLKNGYLKKPSVAVLVREYNSKKVFVFGEVQRPGTFAYEENMSIVQAVTLAGGFTKLASKNAINVTRLVEGQETKIRVAVEDIGIGREKNFVLQPGDIVFVPESFF